MKRNFWGIAAGALSLTMALSGAFMTADAANTEKADVSLYSLQNEKGELSAPVVSSLKSVADGVKIKWKKVEGASAYKIYKKTGDSGWLVAGTAKGTSFTDTKAKSGKTYIYRVRCIDEKGNAVSGYSEGKTLLHIQAPVISKIENTKTGAVITWEKVKGASAYAVYYLEGKSWKKLGTTKKLTYTHNGLKSGKTYTYKIRCLDSKGKKVGGYEENGKSNIFVSAPVISSLKNISNGMKLQWKKVNGAESYRVYRKTGSSGWSYIGTTVSLSYTDKKVSSGTTYTYSVRCFDAQGNLASVRSAEKKAVYIKAPFIKSFENTQSGTKLTWEKSVGASAYAVYYLDGKSWKKLGTTKKLTYTHNDLKSGKIYTYKIRCLDSKGKKIGGAEEGKANLYIAPVSVSELTKTEAGSLIRWSPVKEAAGGYAVYRKIWGGSWVKLAVVREGTEYTDSTAEAGKIYTYAIRCLDGSGKFITAVAEKTRYYNDGKLADGEIKIGEKKYTFNKGYLRSGLQTVNGKTYYYDANGNVKKNGIVGSDKDGWYYADKNGVINLNYVDGVEHGGKEWIVTNGKARKVVSESDRTLYRAAKEVAKATTTKMTKAEKLKACFDYSKKTYDECRPRTPHYMGKDWPVLYANDMFIKGAGNCFSYAAAFAYMAKAIGYESVYSCSSGGHGWAEVDGLIYDPEWSIHNKAYTYFGLDYDKVRDPDYKGGIASGAAWMHVEVK